MKKINKITINIILILVLIVGFSFFIIQKHNKQGVVDIQKNTNNYILDNTDYNNYINFGLQSEKRVIEKGGAKELDAQVSALNSNEEADANNEEWNDCSCEKYFKKEFPIDWSGEVIASFVSGEAIGVKRFDKNAKYKQFYVTLPTEYIDKVHGNIRVIGRLIGVTCAYANSVFGECAADVIADSIKTIN